MAVLRMWMLMLWLVLWRRLVLAMRDESKYNLRKLWVFRHTMFSTNATIHFLVILR